MKKEHFFYRTLRKLYHTLPLPVLIRFRFRSLVLHILSGERRMSYQAWIKRNSNLNEFKREKNMRDSLPIMHNTVYTLVIFMLEQKPSSLLARFVDSIINQLYPNWELIIVCTTTMQEDHFLINLCNKDQRIRFITSKESWSFSQKLSFSFEQSQGKFIAILSFEDVLSQSALYEIDQEIKQNPETKLVYSDEDCVDLRGIRHSPFFKPDWSPELYLSQNYIGELTFYQRKLLLKISANKEWAKGAELFALTLDFTSEIKFSEIRHVPKILYHSNDKKVIIGKFFGKDSFLPRKFQISSAGLKALQNHFKKKNIGAEAEYGDEGWSYRIRYKLLQYPKVSVIILTLCNLNILKPCLKSLLEFSAYPDFEILLVVNEIQYLVEEKAEFLSKISLNPRVRIIDYEDQPFNYSKLNNLAIQQSNGDFLCLLNDDTEVITPDWLTEMVSLASQKGVGAVGAKLYYPDGSIQHGGVVLGKLGGLHAFRFFPGNSGGYKGRLFSTCNYSAVTGACLVVARELYDKVGGLDEKAFPIGFNDIDFCLKLIKQGFRIVWTPYAKLFHKESFSRGHADTTEKEQQFNKELAIFYSRWCQVMEDDPFYNPNLTTLFEDFSLTSFPRKRALYRS